MNYIIENDFLCVTIRSLGAEVISVVDKATGKELWWNADPAYWAGYSPILFPACGGLWNGEYKYNGKTYNMVKHGFVRLMEFTPQPNNEYGSISFCVQETEESLQQYPFAFNLTITYTLNGKTLTCNASVANPSENEVLHYQIGGHPAIMLPDLKKEQRLWDICVHVPRMASAWYVPANRDVLAVNVIVYHRQKKVLFPSVWTPSTTRHLSLTNHR